MTIPAFSTALYQFAPGYGCHVRQPGSDRHPLLTEGIFIHEALHADPFGKSQTSAIARSQAKPCEWWARIEQDSHLPDTAHSIVQNETGLYFLFWQQPDPGHTAPFRLIVAEVTKEFPRFAKLWTFIEKQYPMHPLLTLPV